MTRRRGMALFALAAVVGAGCGGDDDGSNEVVLEEVEPRSTTESPSTTAAPVAQEGDDLEACLAQAGLSMADNGADLPITAGEGGGPAIVQGAEGIGILAGSGAAVAFVYDTAADAASAASLLGVTATGTVVVFVDPEFPPAAVDDVVACLGGAPASTGDEEASGGPATGVAVSDESAACVAGRGFELAEPGATDLPIADADGEGLPTINGAAGIGIRGPTGTAVFYPYATEAEASAAMDGFISDPDVVLVAPRVDAIAVDNVFIASDPGFPSDERFYLADCFD